MGKLKELAGILDEIQQPYQQSTDKLTIKLGFMLPINIHYDYATKQCTFGYNLLAQMVVLFVGVFSSVSSFVSQSYGFASIAISAVIYSFILIILTEIRMQSLKIMVLSRLENTVCH